MCIPKSAIRSFLAVAIAGMAFSANVSAQQGEVPSAEGKSFSATNWYISASAGEQWLLNGYRDGRSFVGKINAGTWITPWHGVKMNAQWGSKKLAGLNSAMYFSAGIDYTLNLLKVFGAGDPGTPFSFSLSAGPAYNMIEYGRGDCGYTHTVSLNLGLNAGYDFSPHWGIFGEIMSYTMDRFYSDEGLPVFTGADWTVGLRYRFSRHKYSSAKVRSLNAEVNSLKERLAVLEQKAAENEKLQAAAEKRVMIAPEDIAASVDIYFDEFSSFISNEQKRKIDDIGAWMKDNPGFSVNIIIFSDGKYGSETDARLRESRASVIRDLLTESYGIEEGRIQVFGSEEAGYRNLSGCNAKIIFSR